MSNTLTTRETSKRELLGRIAARNVAGERPTKHAVVVTDGRGRVPSRTVAGHYRAIDELVRRGMVTDTGTGRAGYALQLTAAGERALAS